jgi:uncharacterized protein
LIETLSALELATVCLVMVLAYMVFGFGGFGANLVSLPILAHFMSLQVAVTLLLVLDLIVSGLLGVRNRQQTDFGEIRRLLPTMLSGMLLGVLLLTWAAERWLLLLLGAFVGCFALWNLFGRPSQQPASARWAWPAGLAGGVFSALFGTGGPVYTLYLARRITDTNRLRATIGAVILGSAFVRLVLFTGSGFFAKPGLLAMSLLLLPCAVLGYAVGSRVQSRLPQASVRRAIWILLLVSALSLLARGLSG